MVRVKRPHTITSTIRLVYRKWGRGNVRTDSSPNFPPGYTLTIKESSGANLIG